MMNTLPQISPQEWEATPASVRSLVQSLLPLAEQISQLNARVSLLENGYASSLPTDSAGNHAKVKRYQDLVDRLFLNTLTPIEETEMQQLNAELEDETAAFYAPIAARMHSLAQSSEAAQ